ncbi:hypothetical protein DSO57_1008607 [Entomophthora muscae]|uniref:Uncharacterized protein n=1 Tax=Entomophthora muscae TaxID=34485 RepID=A0ACC2S943_9FUNG|nr:hypothetical protein DSO57_1008607 [Entomophthora muscae]
MKLFTILTATALSAPATRFPKGYHEEMVHDPDYRMRKFPDQWEEWFLGMAPYMKADEKDYFRPEYFNKYPQKQHAKAGKRKRGHGFVQTVRFY